MIKTGVSKKKELAIMDVYFSNGMNATRAVQTIMPHIAYTTARSIGSLVTKKYKDEIVKRKDEIEDGLNEHFIMSVRERKVELSKIARGISDDEKGISSKDRITAIKVLNAMDGIGVSTGNVTNNYLTMGETAKLVEKKLDSIIDGEYEEVDDSTGQG